MKKKEQFLVRTIGDSPVMMPYGETTLRFNGLIMPNETAAFIWEHLEQADSPEELALRRIRGFTRARPSGLPDSGFPDEAGRLD